MFGSSKTLLNADHYDVYFKGMPSLYGKVMIYFLSPSIFAWLSPEIFMSFLVQVLRRHGDMFELTSGGYYRAHGRADDTMNLGGIKVCMLSLKT